MRFLLNVLSVVILLFSINGCTYPHPFFKPTNEFISCIEQYNKEYRVYDELGSPVTDQIIDREIPFELKLSDIIINDSIGHFKNKWGYV